MLLLWISNIFISKAHILKTKRNQKASVDAGRAFPSMLLLANRCCQLPMSQYGPLDAEPHITQVATSVRPPAEQRQLATNTTKAWPATCAGRRTPLPPSPPCCSRWRASAAGSPASAPTTASTSPRHGSAARAPSISDCKLQTRLQYFEPTRAWVPPPSPRHFDGRASIFYFQLQTDAQPYYI